MEQFSDKVNEYQDPENEIMTSPIWIWFQRNTTSNDSICMICKNTFQRKNGSTTAMITHLQRFHGSLSKCNAAKIFVELSKLKDERQKGKKKEK